MVACHTRTSTGIRLRKTNRQTSDVCEKHPNIRTDPPNDVMRGDSRFAAAPEAKAYIRFADRFSLVLVPGVFHFSLWLRPKHDANMCLLATLVRYAMNRRLWTTQAEGEGPGGRPTGGGNAPRQVGTIWMSVCRKTCDTPSANGRVQNVERTDTESQGQCTS